MPSCELPDIAVIADAHFHDTHSNYDLPVIQNNSKPVTLRSWTDTRRSSRVFNESGPALIATLDDIVARGIVHVVLLGDYTDDGQLEATRRLLQLLRQYRDRHGLQFYAIPGNHDCYGPAGKHQSTRFLAGTAGNTVLVSSDAAVAALESDTSVLTRKMYCDGSPAGLLPMREFGLCRQEHYLHWESPFGDDDEFASRCYDARSADGQTVHSLVDASYLLEPSPGLWLLLIDANVFEPRNGQSDITRKKAFIDSSDAGWNAVLRCKPYLLTWISDVCTRARQQGKTLLAFSHYPTMDPFDDWSLSEGRLFGETEALRRRPGTQVARMLLDAGLSVHLGGHLHVNAKSTICAGDRQFTDIVVPSLVAFPPAYKRIRAKVDHCQIETIALDTLALDPWLMEQYRTESEALQRRQDRALDARTHGDFLYRRMYSRVTEHYLPKEWPPEIVSQLDNRNAADLAYFLMLRRQGETSLPFGFDPARVLAEVRTGSTGHLPGDPLHDSPSRTLAGTLAACQNELESSITAGSLSITMLADCSMLDLIVDWYCLRHAGHQAAGFLPLFRLPLYRFLAQQFGDLHSVENDSTAAFLHVFLGVLQQSLQRLEATGSMIDTIELPP